MIEPIGHLKPRHARPSFNVPLWQRCLGLLARSWIRKRIDNDRPQRLKRMREVLAQAHQCQSREDLEALMGPPQYVMDGSLYSRIPTDGEKFEQPEIVEVYERDNCGIELMFRNGRVIGMLGVPMPTTWEFATDALPGNEDLS